MGGYTTAVSGQRLGEHVPAARQQILNNATAAYNNVRAVFCMVRAEIREGTRLV
jgi:hypothetical protein